MLIVHLRLQFSTVFFQQQYSYTRESTLLSPCTNADCLLCALLHRLGLWYTLVVRRMCIFRIFFLSCRNHTSAGFYWTPQSLGQSEDKVRTEEEQALRDAAKSERRKRRELRYVCWQWPGHWRSAWLDIQAVHWSLYVSPRRTSRERHQPTCILTMPPFVSVRFASLSYCLLLWRTHP